MRLRQQPGLSGAGGGGGCILGGNPPDPPRWETNPFRVSSIQTFSRHVVLLPFPTSLGSPRTFSIFPPPQPLPSGWPPADSRYRFSWVSKTRPWGEPGSGDTGMAALALQGSRGSCQESRPHPPGPHQPCILFPAGHRWLFLPRAPGSPGSWDPAVGKCSSCTGSLWEPGRRKPSALL